MTSSSEQQPKEHCDHECVCKEYRQWYLNAVHIDQMCPDSDTCDHYRSRPHPAPARSGCDGCRKETEHLDCPTPGHCDQMKCPICCEGSDFPTLPEEIKKYEAEAARTAREDVLKKVEPIFEHVTALCDDIIEIQDPQSKWGFNSLLIKHKIESLRTTTPHTEQERIPGPCKTCTDPNQCYVPCHKKHEQGGSSEQPQKYGEHQCVCHWSGDSDIPPCACPIRPVCLEHNLAGSWDPRKRVNENGEACKGIVQK